MDEMRLRKHCTVGCSPGLSIKLTHYFEPKIPRKLSTERLVFSIYLDSRTSGSFILHWVLSYVLTGTARVRWDEVLPNADVHFRTKAPVPLLIYAPIVNKTIESKS